MFAGLVRRAGDGTQPCIDYLLKHTELLVVLIDGYAQRDEVPFEGAQRSRVVPQV